MNNFKDLDQEHMVPFYNSDNGTLKKGMVTIHQDDPATPELMARLENNLFVLAGRKKPDWSRRQRRDWARKEAKIEFKKHQERDNRRCQGCPTCHVCGEIMGQVIGAEKPTWECPSCKAVTGIEDAGREVRVPRVGPDALTLQGLRDPEGH